jgi:anthranilate phosphoribosyltransferase
VVVHGVSHDPTRVLTETIFDLMGIPATLHAGQAQARLDGHEPVYIPVGVLSAAGKTAGDALAHGRAQQRPHAGQAGDAVCRRCGAAPVERFAPGIRRSGGEIFAEIGGRALLMHGTEGEVYANPQRCPQISLIDAGYAGG